MASEQPRDLELTPLYRSENGDRWLLVHDRVSGSVLVRHVPNPPSGGVAVDLPVSEFLATARSGPEHQAARAWIERGESTAVEEP